MDFRLMTQLSQQASCCLVIGITDQSLAADAELLKHPYFRLISRLASKLHEPGDRAWQSELGESGSSLLLLHCGVNDQFTPRALKKSIKNITTELLANNITSATLYLPRVINESPDWQLQQMLLQLDYHRYQFLDYKRGQPKPHRLEQVTFFLPEATQEALVQGNATAAGIRFARDLGNLPANCCTPTHLADYAKTLETQHNTLRVNVMDLEMIKALEMNTLLAVASGSREPPRFIEVHYKGDNDAPPVVLVGKGVTFDSGGLTLKLGDAMSEMKYDMLGAAAVLGTLKTCAMLKLPLNVIGLIPSTENMISDSAMKPGDVVTSLSGQTVEIINTDAEGRLILADALTYAEQFKPRFVLDIATLTGAMVTALGTVNTGFMTSDEALAQLISTAAAESGDSAWRMPLDEEYQDALESPVADMINANFDRTASSITAACFLSRFTSNYRWAHLDIAGTAWIFGKQRTATGRPISLLVHLLNQVAHAR